MVPPLRGQACEPSAPLLPRPWYLQPTVIASSRFAHPPRPPSPPLPPSCSGRMWQPEPWHPDPKWSGARRAWTSHLVLCGAPSCRDMLCSYHRYFHPPLNANRETEVRCHQASGAVQPIGATGSAVRGLSPQTLEGEAGDTSWSTFVACQVSWDRTRPEKTDYPTIEGGRSAPARATLQQQTAAHPPQQQSRPGDTTLCCGAETGPPRCSCTTTRGQDKRKHPHRRSARVSGQHPPPPPFTGAPRRPGLTRAAGRQRLVVTVRPSVVWFGGGRNGGGADCTPNGRGGGGGGCPSKRKPVLTAEGGVWPTSNAAQPAPPKKKEPRRQPPTERSIPNPDAFWGTRAHRKAMGHGTGQPRG